jgi:ADP-ribose pyrophosphatase
MMDETLRLPLRIESGEIVYQDRNQTISRVTACFDGFSKEYFVSDHGQRVAVLVVRGNDVLLVRQYRLLINGLSYEIPGGRVGEGETLEAAAARECLEESGVRCWNLEPLISYHAALDIWKNRTHIFLSEECEEVVVSDPDRRVWIALPRCIDMVFEQQIVDSLSIVALLAYHTLKIKQGYPIEPAAP